MRNLFISFFTIIILIFCPLLLAWWLFFPLALLSAFFFSKIYETIFAGFILDLIYFADSGVKFPMLTLFALAIFVLSMVVRDKLRL